MSEVAEKRSLAIGFLPGIILGALLALIGIFLIGFAINNPVVQFIGFLFLIVGTLIFAL